MALALKYYILFGFRNASDKYCRKQGSWLQEKSVDTHPSMRI